MRLNEHVLSGRQHQILALVAEGLSDKEIAIRLCLSASTVKTYLSRLYRYYGLKNRAQAAHFFTEKDVARRIAGLEVHSSGTGLNPLLSSDWLTAEIPTVQSATATAPSSREVTHAKTTDGDLRVVGAGRIVSS